MKYPALKLAFILLLALGVLVGWRWTGILLSSPSDTKALGGVLLAIGTLFLAGYTVHRFWKLIPWDEPWETITGDKKNAKPTDPEPPTAA